MTLIDESAVAVTRRIPFEFPDDLEPVWNSNHHEWSHMINGASLTMPYLEPFLIATLREAAKEIDDPQLAAEIGGFVAQEGQHFRTHRRYNELLKRSYPQLADVEEKMKAGYKRMSERRSLAYRLGYSAGFESMTLGVTKWLVDDRVKLFAGSDTRVASFTLWHMVEEVEHKRVAFDAYQAAVGREWHRKFGVLSGSMHVFWWARKGAISMLKSDGLWRSPRSRLRLWRRTWDFFAAIVPGALEAMRASHDPRDVADPEWVQQWWANFDPEQPVLVDTSHPDIPVPGTEASAA